MNQRQHSINSEPCDPGPTAARSPLTRGRAAEATHDRRAILRTGFQGSPSAPAGGATGIASLFLIGLLALAVRLVYLRQIETIPFFHHPVGDAAAYTAWARTIAAGDWMGSETFYQAPAYPYFLAVIHLLMGADLWAVRVVQAVLGAIACALIAGAGWLLFDRRAGLAAGLLLALYPPAIFFDGLIQKASLGLVWMTLLLLLLAWIGRTAERRTGQPTAVMPGRWIAVGAVLGLLALTRENALVLVFPIALWLWIRFRVERLAVRVVRSAALLAGIGAVLVPVGVRNYLVGGEFALTTVQAGPNFFIGNSEIATGRYVALKRGHESPPFERRDAKALAEAACGRALSDGEVSRYWWGRAWNSIRTHPGQWAALLGKKVLLVWNAYEIPDTECYDLYRQRSSLLGTLGAVLHFGVLCPLAAIGIAFTGSRRRDLWWLYLFIVVLTGAVAAFYVVARYRYPLVPLLVLLAGAGAVRGYAALKARDTRAVVIATGVAVAVAVVVNLRINPERRLNAIAFANLGSVLAEQGSLDGAVRFFETALEGAPDSAEVHFNLGQAFALQGRFADAVEAYRQALELEPGLIHADYNLAVALEALGRIAQAVHHYGRALFVDPNDADARAALQRLGMDRDGP